jgi:hypothetical protein
MQHAGESWISGDIVHMLMSMARGKHQLAM